MDTECLYKLIRYILKETAENEEWSFRELGPIHLIKYVYLADLYYAAQNDGKTFTGINWRFYHFGPWNLELYQEIPNAIKAIGASTSTFDSQYAKDQNRYSLKNYCRCDSSVSIPLQISSLLRRDIRNFGSATHDLLHYVYTTPPMTNAVPGEYLNFKHFLFAPKKTLETEISDKPTSREKKKRKKRILDIKEKIAKKREDDKKKRIRPPQPRYDEIFFHGTMELDKEIECLPLENHNGILQVNQNAWSGNWRKDRDLP
jgi:hypothetical protein